VDWVFKGKLFPWVEMGEWLIYRNMGAYCLPVECEFNGYPVTK
jgi:diaminopimelate decarboxylase